MKVRLDFVKTLIKRLSYKIFSYFFPEYFLKLRKIWKIFELRKLNPTHLNGVTVQQIFEISQSQICQDFLVLSVFGPKYIGTFVEAGACDGYFCSNTLLLEKSFNWKGILVEPNSYWRDHNQVICRAATWYDGCLSKNCGVIDFKKVESPELSGIANHQQNDSWNKERKKSSIGSVKFISLGKLLEISDFGDQIDYLSLDTEGSEFEILSSIDFNRIQIGIITVEHNYNKTKRDSIFTLLTSRGFARVMQNISDHDDWYISQTLMDRIVLPG